MMKVMTLQKARIMLSAGSLVFAGYEETEPGILRGIVFDQGNGIKYQVFDPNFFLEHFAK